eukprot:scaffold1470_cov118-Isochrysis_galbana.AAC.6
MAAENECGDTLLSSPTTVHSIATARLDRCHTLLKKQAAHCSQFSESAAQAIHAMGSAAAELTRAASLDTEPALCTSRKRRPVRTVCSRARDAAVCPRAQPGP